jgi:alpha-1,3-rhamnosyl/mannosyltransferase
MRILLSVTKLTINLELNNLDGIAYYTKNLINEFSKLRLNFQLIALTKRGANKIKFKQVYKTSNFFIFFLHKIFSGNKISYKLESSDLLHITDHIVPFTKNIPLIANVMDTYSLSHPNMLSGSCIVRAIKNWLWIVASRQADHIITISNFSKQDIIKYMGIPEEKISVIPLGVDEIYYKKIPKKNIEAIKKKYNIPTNYFLFVGTFQPRKNLNLIVEAYQKLPGKIKDTHALVLVGNDNYNHPLILNAKEKINTNSIISLQGVSEKEKISLMQGAKCLLLPSLYEGFGLPILEAFASKIPVITSNISSMPEVAGDCAILIDPHKVNSLVEAMIQISKNSIFVKKLINKGYQRSKLFSWNACAKATIKIYIKVIKEYHARSSYL